MKKKIITAHNKILARVPPKNPIKEPHPDFKALFIS
jgi:hypothetical protein